MATEVGIEVMTGPRSLEKVKRDLEAAGYKGERVVFVVPTDLPSLNAMSQLAADMFRKVGVNLDYQALDWGTVLPRLANKEGLDRGGWSVWCNYIPGIIATTPATQSYVRGLGRNGPFGWPESADRGCATGTRCLEEQQRICRDVQCRRGGRAPHPDRAWMRSFCSAIPYNNGFVVPQYPWG